MGPAAAIAGGSTLASIFLNNRAAANVRKARAKAMGEEDARQHALDAEADAINTGAQDRYKGFGAGADASGDRISSYFTGLNDRSMPAQVMPASTSQATNHAVARETGEANAFGDQQANALGDVMGFGDYLGGLNRAQARDAGSIAQIGGFKTGSAGVNGLELLGANQKGGKARMLADALQLASRVAASAAIGGGQDAGGWTTRIE